MSYNSIAFFIMNNIGSLTIAIALLASVRVISKGNFFFKDNDVISTQREIKELRNQVNELTITVNGDDELVGVIGTIDKLKSELRKTNSINLNNDIINKVENAISEVSESLLQEKITNSELIKSDINNEFERIMKY